ncbi:MAG: collagen binding domain-containing protein, partial [Pyrinomonadaceae bacterium]
QVRDFALNRMSVGLDTTNRSIDILDSQVNISPASLNNLTMRGFHMSAKPKAEPKDNLPAKGLEVFAGLARPSLAFFDTNGGKLAGIMAPVITKDSFQARAGVIAISADKYSREARGGIVFLADVAYAPTREILADAEMSYANGDLSWRGRLDLRYAKYRAYGEVTRFARTSPLNSIGAQYGGRKSEAFSFYWRPDRRFATSVGYNHTQVSRLRNSQLADYDRSLLFSNVSYEVSKDLRLTLRYTDQKIETAFPGSVSKFAIQTRTLSFGNSYKFNSNWSNTIEGRLNFNREANADASLEKGFSLNEQLRFGWGGGSVTGFLRYNHKSPSLTSLLVRNPGLLPPALQVAFALDPAEFLRLNRDRIAYLLGGIELPQTRSMDAGVRFQKSISRYTISAATRYNAGEVYAVNQKDLYTSASLGVRLDRANSMQISAWRSFGGGGRSGMTISYTHQFGSSGDGFQFSKLFSFTNAKVRGRVFYDLNANGISDPGEPGVAGMKIQIDGKRSAITDKNGRYELSANSDGRQTVALTSAELGVRLIASTPTEQTVGANGRQKLDVNFGVRDHGSMSGRVINDLGHSGGAQAENSPGLAGVKVTLRSADTGFGSFVLEQLTSADGAYLFPNLRPGKYLVEIDTATLPPNYNIPGITGSSLVVQALQTSYYDISITAQRAITGIVYIDQNGDGRYTDKVDDPVPGAFVSLHNSSATSGIDGAYILRNLPAGKANVIVRAPSGALTVSIVVELGAAPITRRSADLSIESR